MSALTDLQDKLAATSSKVAKLTSDVDAFIAANSGGATDADLVNLSGSVDTLNSTIDALDAKIAPPVA